MQRERSDKKIKAGGLYWASRRAGGRAGGLAGDVHARARTCLSHNRVVRGEKQSGGIVWDWRGNVILCLRV